MDNLCEIKQTFIDAQPFLQSDVLSEVIRLLGFLPEIVRDSLTSCQINKVQKAGSLNVGVAVIRIWRLLVRGQLESEECVRSA